MRITYPIAQPHTLTPEMLAGMLHTDLHKGLTKEEAENRTLIFGPNIYERKRPPGIALIFVKQFQSLVVYLLFAGALISLYFRDLAEAVSILVVIFINSIIGFAMEWQARNATTALSKMEVITAKVLRDGFLTELPALRVVPGDMLQLEAGDVVPADGRLIDARQFRCDESALTGESQPVDKQVQAVEADTTLADRRNMVFKGTSVVNGNGTVVITGIAGDTELGRIAAMVDTAGDSQTPLSQKLRKLTQKLVLGTLMLTGIFIVAGIIQGKKPLLILETAIALSVASIPEGLPVVTTIALSAGMLAMARHNAIIKNLSAVEALGSTDVILTDKTGTLTENQIKVQQLTFPEEKFIRLNERTWTISEKYNQNLEKLVLVGILCNNAHGRPTAASDPIELSLIELANSTGLDIAATLSLYPRISEIPFSSEAMMMISLHKTPEGYFTAAKGAAEQLLSICDRFQTGSQIKSLTTADSGHVLQQADEMAGEGLRVLAFAWKQDSDPNHRHFSNGLIFIGLAGLLDPPRMDVRNALQHCKQAGIKVVMITGDHPLTALHIARNIGLTDHNHKAVINGKWLPAGSSLTGKWKQKILHATIFARTTPQQKLEIATVFQQAGHIVAMTGDGINDAPALKQADIGIAMGLRGTQVARETADIVLRDDSFSSITEAIARGRVIFRNIQKFAVYLVSCNLTEILTITALSLLIPGAALWPLQILFLNVVTDVFPALALGMGPSDQLLMHRAPRDPAKAILHKEKWIQIIRDASLITICITMAIVYGKHLGYAVETLNNIAFFSLTFAQLAHVFNMRDKQSHWLINEVTRNPFIWLAILLCLVITGSPYLIQPLKQVLHIILLPWLCWLIAVVAGIVPLAVIQFIRLISVQIKPHDKVTANR